MMLKMNSRNMFQCLFLLLLLFIESNEGLLFHGNTVNSNDSAHSLTGHNVDLAEMKQMLMNITSEFEYLKQQTTEKNAEIETLKQKTTEIDTLKHQSKTLKQQVETLRQQTETLTENLKQKTDEIDVLKQQTETFLKQKTAEIDTLRQQNAEQIAQIEALKQNFTEIDTLGQENAEQITKIKALEQQTNNDRNTTQLLQNRVFFLEAEQTKLSNLASTQAQELSSYLTKMNQLAHGLIKTEATDQNVTLWLNNALQAINSLEQTFLSTTHNLGNQSNEIKVLKQGIDKYQTTTQQLNGSLIQVMHDVQTLIADINPEVAFTAAITIPSTTWNSGTLVFNVVITNKGNGYNPSTGVFTSPRSGTYVFYVSAIEYNTHDLGLEIVLNNNPKVRLVGNSHAAYQTGTNMVVLNLLAGDRIWVKHFAGNGYYTYSVPALTFSGFRLV